jgi:hypothetical protein
MAAFNDILAEVNDWVRRNNAIFNGVEPGNIIPHLGVVNPTLWNRLNDAYKTGNASESEFTNKVKKGAELGFAAGGPGGAATGAVGGATAGAPGGDGPGGLLYSNPVTAAPYLAYQAVGGKFGGSPGAPTLNEWAKSHPDVGQSFFNATGDLPPAPPTADELSKKDKQKYLTDHADNADLTDEELATKQQYLTDLGGSKDDLKTISDIIGQRQQETSNNAALDQQQASLQDELAAGTNAYVQNQSANAEQQFNQELAPRIAQNANIRGSLYSGDFGSELAGAAGQVYDPIAQQEAQLRQNDIMFYTDAAYQNAFRKAQQATGDFQAQLGNTRQTAQQTQQNNFASGQNELTRNFNQMLLQRQQEQALNAQNAQQRTNQNLANQQRQADTVGQIGSVVGQIGGAVIGSKLAAGAVVRGGVTS